MAAGSGVTASTRTPLPSLPDSQSDKSILQSVSGHSPESHAQLASSPISERQSSPMLSTSASSTTPDSVVDETETRSGMSASSQSDAARLASLSESGMRLGTSDDAACEASSSEVSSRANAPPMSESHSSMTAFAFPLLPPLAAAALPDLGGSGQLRLK